MMDACMTDVPTTDTMGPNQLAQRVWLPENVCISALGLLLLPY